MALYGLVVLICHYKSTHHSCKCSAVAGQTSSWLIVPLLKYSSEKCVIALETCLSSTTGWQQQLVFLVVFLSLTLILMSRWVFFICLVYHMLWLEVTMDNNLIRNKQCGFQEIVVMLEEQMNPLVQAEMSVLVDILYHPEVLFHSTLPSLHGFSSFVFMTKYGRLLLYYCFFVVISTAHWQHLMLLIVCNNILYCRNDVN